MSNQHVSTITRLVMSACLAFAATSTLETATAADPTLVKTRQGIVRGALEDGVVVFKGVSYAAAPAGALRWQPPRRPATWDGVRDAAAFGLPCPTFDGSKMAQGRWLNRAGADIFVDVPPAPGTSEDCLHLNVWAPADARRAAVMVWLQPLGSSSMPLFNGAAFARDGVIFVSLDVRAFSFVHPALTAEAGRKEPVCCLGTQDQIAALRWVMENIAAFGGDPVT